jgi:uncharacterized protein YacL
VVPRFVLDELQRLADSGDPLKREKGKAALDRLQKMQLDPNLSVTLHESESASELPWIRASCSSQDCSTCPFSRMMELCAIARLQNVSVLNLHDLSRALRLCWSRGIKWSFRW